MDFQCLKPHLFKYFLMRVKQRTLYRTFSKKNDTGKVTVRIGDSSHVVRPPKHPELVPVGYLPARLPRSVLEHLRWMLQKDALGQDIFLLGPPGPRRRVFALQYLELTKQEVEYVALSRDTTDTDLKQRREITSSSAHYIDQSAVKAAIEGRVLLLDGIEKAERNVLPVLNNLLENREMQLEDGRFLVHPVRYDKLLLEHSKDELSSWNLVRVADNFRVIALGLPVPPYRGNPLDPPLRSRFQVRNIEPMSFQEQFTLLKEQHDKIAVDKLSRILSVAHTLMTEESKTLGFPDFPVESLSDMAYILAKVPQVSMNKLISWLYPYQAFLNNKGCRSVEHVLKNLHVDSDSHLEFESVQHESNNQKYLAVLRDGNETIKFEVDGGKRTHLSTMKPFVSTSYHKSLLAEMLQCHLVRDLCIIGPKGSGKSALAGYFAKLLGYQMELMMVYQDMSARDLLQQRVTLENGDTSWRPSPLVMAALKGKLVVLDGLHRAHPSTLSTLHSLTQNREVQLYDGTRLLHHDRFDQLKKENGFSNENLADRNIFRIHPSFRILALAEPPKVGGSFEQWLNSESLTMFLFHQMRALTMAEEKEVIEILVGATSLHMHDILKFVENLRASEDPMVQSLALSLSTRQLLRIARRFRYFPQQSCREAIDKACMTRFLPPLAKNALERSLRDAGIEKSSEQLQKNATECYVKDGIVYIGNTSTPVHQAGSGKVKVPDILFFENDQHISILEAMLQDFTLGEHLLLVGNQGVGKNKIVDRFLQLLNRPREYLQLHRDTSVQTLTLQPSVKDGRIVYQDSPLVRAVQQGHILVVDEADKAPTHVTCILKALVESGEMLLSDGRRIVHPGDTENLNDSAVIQMHPEFRMIVLANRPGFPFLGNDFFGALGDIFSCHAIDNPTVQSEMTMLRQYGPNVPQNILEKLVAAFGELRQLADQNLLNYPYSTREIVNIVKHIESYPEDGVAQVIRNVFDFDSYATETKKLLFSVLHKHGIPVGARILDVNLGRKMQLPQPVYSYKWIPSFLKNPYVQKRPLNINNLAKCTRKNFMVEKHDPRGTVFTEQLMSWKLPLEDMSIITDVVVTNGVDGEKANKIHIMSACPSYLFSLSPSEEMASVLDLHSILPTTWGFDRLRFQLLPLSEQWRDWLVVHEGLTNTMLLVCPSSGKVSQIKTGAGLMEATVNFASSWSRGTQKQQTRIAFGGNGSTVVTYQSSGTKIDIMELDSKFTWTVELPFKVHSVHAINKNAFLLSSQEKNRYLLEYQVVDQWTLQKLVESSLSGYPGQIDGIIGGNQLFKPLSDNPESQHVLATSQDFAGVALGLLDQKDLIQIHTYPREIGEVNNTGDSRVWSLSSGEQLIRIRQPELVPLSVKEEGGEGLFLEVVDLAKKTVSFIPVFQVEGSAQRRKIFPYDILASAGSEDFVTVDQRGNVKMWELAPSKLEKSLYHWKKLVGTEEGRDLQITVEQESGKSVSAPKHGRIDPSGAPHVGGNTWAGGTGGRDTAGLGGKGGPYRLDAGHDVYQVPDWEKNNVPIEVKKAAREMAEKAFKERLNEIKMSNFDAQLYQQISGPIQRQVQSMRVILDSVQAKGKERQWIRHQTSGELDDSKLVESLTGERSIYKRRGEQEPELGSPLELPKRLRLVVDVSGSMYRFNGYDRRLDRQLESVLMMMEAFEGYQHKFQYDIVGHSGEDSNIPFVPVGKYPANDKERLDILKMLHAHSQFCMSGDNTLQATQDAINAIAKTAADEHFVVVLSDANLERYGIPPRAFANVMTSDPQVNVYAVFIGSLGDQAHRLSRQLPPGRAFLCMNTSELPQILQQIFMCSMLTN
ncbi:von Willebrand factor A domain-containing protein 8-like isoform X1 [Limulus polyphemus]|uniref:von Willebrand factor A domain-containing protein 8-like isoform X1 n=3 Tax=Limulus polyphemus TaxID=6850 RepID=A0ABM1BFI1_LIMPO|nr:von Willebrand factor A domain-containing protein 8-like isoform X1 [Limulus polyphemus]